jgi:hypothetical protein
MLTAPPDSANAPPVGERVVSRITYLIPVFGITAVIVAGLLSSWDWAEGLIFGCGLAWLNFRWLKRGLEAFTSAAAAQVGAESFRAPVATYLAAVFRYALIGVAVYAIFHFLHVPLVSIVLGLCALAVATITASVWEILQSVGTMRS